MIMMSDSNEHFQYVNVTMMRTALYTVPLASQVASEKKMRKQQYMTNSNPGRDMPVRCSDSVMSSGSL